MSIDGTGHSINFVSEKTDGKGDFLRCCGVIFLILLIGNLTPATTAFALTATQRDFDFCEKDPDLEKAKRHCRIVWESFLNPPVTKEKAWLAIHNLGVIDALSGKYQNAVDYFDRAIKLFPRKAESIQERGRKF